MNDLERQVATLLKDAPGEPPITLDLDALSSAPVPRQRFLAPLIAAAAVLALAVPVAVLVDRGSPPKTPTSSPTTGPVHDRPTSPRQAAVRTAETIIATAPAPPGAIRLDPPPPAALITPYSTPAQHVQRTRFWTAPATIDTTVSYLQAHPPTGMHLLSSGSAGGAGSADIHSLDFSADQIRSLHYTVIAYHGGSAIRADAVVLWAPQRAAADTVPASLNSIDVLVVRHDPQLNQGAPTVHRTLTGTTARDLADFINRLPRAIPGGSASCSADPSGERRIDRLVFHSAGTTATLVVNLLGCSSATFQVGHRTPIQLSGSRLGVVADIDERIMTTLGLPPNYGS